jgi:ABC-type Fe3+-hydroxamate transport system substrate-binding protein
MTRILLSFSLLALAAGCGSSGSGSSVDALAGDTGVATDGTPSDAIAGGPPVLKFCNQLIGPGNAPVTLTLSIGNPAVSFTATSGHCDPAPPTPCRAVSSGGAVSAVLLDSGGVQLNKGSLSLLPGTEYIFFSALDANNQPYVTGGMVTSSFRCATIDPFPRDGGAPDGM